MKKSELKNGMIVQITTGPWIDFDDMGYILNNRILFQQSVLDLNELDENLEAIYSSNACSCDIEAVYELEDGSDWHFNNVEANERLHQEYDKNLISYYTKEKYEGLKLLWHKNSTVKKLNETIFDLIQEHEGGEKFFDAIDNYIKNNENVIDAILNMINKTGNNTQSAGLNIIVSGEFGRIFASKYATKIDNLDTLIVVNGGIRKGNMVDDLSIYDLQGKQFIFLDDSFFKGRTRNRIAYELEKNGAKLTRTYVAYDGCIDKQFNVHSLFRYYDNEID